MILFIVYNHVGFSPAEILIDQSPAHLKNGCICNHKNVTYNFCYQLPSNRLIKGKRFNCNFSSYLEEFGILSSSNIIDLETKEMPMPAFVTAMSENHYAEGLTLVRFVCISCAKNWRGE
ncbi:unnamed protein product [Cylicocyclus nassatus]|uniref:Uncharacterized protein n=1 Tax=Cylicocyclus nassatus TaxID=53992 RepID=A0AA36GU53_CYLNA|nr:unnamed protein product [Cylicocyclus nassatus]